MFDGVPPFRAVLFDFFGTLTQAVRRGPAHSRIATMLGCDPGRWVSLLDRTFYRRAAGEFGTPLVGLRRLAQGLGATPSESALRAAYGARIEAVQAEGPLRTDAVAVLQRIRRRGLRTGVISDCWYELPAIMPGLPIASLLDATVYSVDVGRCKPAPEMYQAACQRLGVTPAQCLYIGDGSSRELTGAEEVGMTAVRLDAWDLADHLSFAADTDWQGPAVSSLTQLESFLDRQPALV